MFLSSSMFFHTQLQCITQKLKPMQTVLKAKESIILPFCAGSFWQHQKRLTSWKVVWKARTQLLSTYHFL